MTVVRMTAVPMTAVRMTVVPPTAAAYKRYLDKFDAQETQIEQYQADVKKLQGVEFKQRKELEDYLANFSAE